MYDVVIIGGGLGGLSCGVMLAREGMQVCVLEQDVLLGGCLQSFQRNGRLIDSGIHYVGCLGEGQILRQYFRYFGVWNDLSVVPLDHKFDVIRLGDREFPYLAGYEDFEKSLAEQFPAQRDGLKRYCRRIRQIGDTVSVETHRNGRISSGGLEALGESAAGFIESCVDDPLLREVLSATNVLYGGVKERSNLYLHAMINHSNIEGAYCFAGGTQQLADRLVEQIRHMGGEVHNRSRVVRLHAEEGVADYAETVDGERFYGHRFISDLHPAATLSLIGEQPQIRHAYRERIASLENTYALFASYLLMKPNEFPFLNRNYYNYVGQDAWQTMYRPKNPACVLLNTQVAHLGDRFSDVVALLTPMPVKPFEKWRGLPPERRGEEYEALKAQIASELLDLAERYHPGLKSAVDKIVTASPLTYESYTSTPDGSAYGVLKDWHEPYMTLQPVRTKLRNLLLTGQNINAHGVLGVVLTAATTCAEWIGEELLARKIGNA